jgi:natural product precursor
MKKLKLNKEIIASLESQEMNKIKGGNELFGTRVTCLTIKKCATKSCKAPICIPTSKVVEAEYRIADIEF